jgi:hypothetical protein
MGLFCFEMTDLGSDLTDCYHGSISYVQSLTVRTKIRQFRISSVNSIWSREIFESRVTLQTITKI